MPYCVCSSVHQPAPMPISTRPPEISSTVAADFASTDGRRNVTGDTSVPSRIRSVSAASAASSAQASVEPRPPTPSELK